MTTRLCPWLCKQAPRYQLAWPLFAALGLASGSARGQEPQQRDDFGHRTTDELRGEVVPLEGRGSSDGVYGRFEGDVTFMLGLGAEFGDGTRGAVLGRALYFHTAGVVAGYSDSFGAESELERALFVGIELRPLFLPRWSMDMQLGSALVDLTIDSLAFGVGMYAGQGEAESFATPSGLELAAGFGIPLFGKAEGPWLEARGTYRTLAPESAFGGAVLLGIYESWISPVIR
jgi:hypothetical protein